MSAHDVILREHVTKLVSAGDPGSVELGDARRHLVPGGRAMLHAHSTGRA